MQTGDPTPWGRADHVTKIADGIYAVSTPSHGGVFLTPERNALIPADIKAATFNGGQGALGWYEEDCDWAVPFLVYLQEFDLAVAEGNAHDVKQRRATMCLESFHPGWAAQRTTKMATTKLYKIDDRAHATILAALRYWQLQGLMSEAHAIHDIANNEGTLDPLSHDEIGVLCERFNCGDLHGMARKRTHQAHCRASSKAGPRRRTKPKLRRPGACINGHH